jgi:hypothetical protein
MRAGNDVAKRTLALTQRPRILVRAFYFSKSSGVGGLYSAPSGIEEGSLCDGQFYIQNCRGTDARIREIFSDVYIANTLPMKRPYEGREGSKEEKTLMPGTSTFYLFVRAEPLDSQTRLDLTAGGPERNLYVLGWIGYTDDLGIYRITAFCRRYDTRKRRFIPVDDADYEFAD